MIPLAGDQGNASFLFKLNLLVHYTKEEGSSWEPMQQMNTLRNTDSVFLPNTGMQLMPIPAYVCVTPGGVYRIFS